MFQLLVVLAFLLILLGMLFPAVLRTRLAASRMTSMNNLKQIGLAMHNYNDSIGHFPAGVDDNNFSALALILPFIEQINVYNKIDFGQSVDHADNAEMRKALIKVYLSPVDQVPLDSEKSAPTNYFLVAGTNYELEDNNGTFYRDSKLTFARITDGASNTTWIYESLRGDGKKSAVTVRRQHVQLTKDDLNKLQESAGVKEFENDEKVVGTRGSSWMDGRFLRSSTNVTRRFNDDRPDVDCGGIGGLAGARADENETRIGMVDGSVRTITSKADHEVWKALATRSGGEVIPAID